MRRLSAGLVTVLMVAIAMNLSACSLEQPPQYVPVDNPEYRALDSPEAPVYNAFLAIQQGDFEKAREQYTGAIGGVIDGTYQGLRHSPEKSDKLVILGSRLRIGQDPDYVFVKIKQIGYDSFAFFFIETSFFTETSDEREVLVRRTEDGWKINSVELFLNSGGDPPGIEL